MSGDSGRVKAFAVALLAISTLVAPAEAQAIGSGSFSPTGSMGTPRLAAGVAPLRDGRVLVAGGDDQTGTPLGTVEVFDPASGTWSPLPSMPVPRVAPMAAQLPDGRVLIAGGSTTGSPAALQSALIFDPGSGTYTPTGNMLSPRSGSAVSALADGRVLIAGGINFLTTYDTAEAYNPQTGTFSAVGNLSTVRQGKPTASPLPGGGALVMGGTNSGGGSPFDTAEAFNPASNSFSAAGIGTMSTGRSAAVSASLPDGRILVAGGTDATAKALVSAEAFSPQTGTFSSAGIGSMGTPRISAMAAPLPDGRVLVAGGTTGPASQALSSAEIYSATNDFSFTLQGRTLNVSVQATGKVAVSDAASPLSATAAKKKRKKRKSSLLLNPSSSGGDPPTIAVTLSLTKAAKLRLKRKGHVTVNARITFTPQGGLPKTQTAALRIQGKKHKRKRK